MWCLSCGPCAQLCEFCMIFSTWGVSSTPQKSITASPDATQQEEMCVKPFSSKTYHPPDMHKFHLASREDHRPTHYHEAQMSPAPLLPYIVQQGSYHSFDHNCTCNTDYLMSPKTVWVVKILSRIAFQTTDWPTPLLVKLLCYHLGKLLREGMRDTNNIFVSFKSWSS